MVHAAVRAGDAAGGVVRGRTRRRGLDLATTPGRLWLALIGLAVPADTAVRPAFSLAAERLAGRMPVFEFLPPRIPACASTPR